MRLSGPVLSAAVHAAIGAGMFLLVRSPIAQSVLPMMLLDAVAPKTAEATPPRAPKPSRPSRPSATGRRGDVRAAATPPPGMAPASETASPSPVLDLGLVLEGESGDLPAGAIAIPAPAARPQAPTPSLQSTIRHRPECADPDVGPEPAERVEIEYPLASRAAGAQGRLVVRVFVAPDGSVSKTSVVSSVDPSVDQATVAALRRWRFHPARRCGRPVAGSYVVAMRFELSD